MNTYKPRIADVLLRDRLLSAGAVLIQGPKWWGKTTTAEQIASSTLYLDDPDTISENLQMASTAARRLLAGPAPRLIDEYNNLC